MLGYKWAYITVIIIIIIIIRTAMTVAAVDSVGMRRAERHYKSGKHYWDCELTSACWRHDVLAVWSTQCWRHGRLQTPVQRTYIHVQCPPANSLLVVSVGQVGFCSIETILDFFYASHSSSVVDDDGGNGAVWKMPFLLLPTLWYAAM